MGIKPTFSKADVKAMFDDKFKRLDKVIIDRLQYIGETFVNNARLNGTYLDQTGNLRSSIGFIVMKNGEVLVENFEASSNGTDKQTGIATGKEYIRVLMSEKEKGYVLIVVAGMNYASAVESKNKDVLTSSAIIAKQDVLKAIESFKNAMK